MYFNKSIILFKGYSAHLVLTSKVFSYNIYSFFLKRLCFSVKNFETKYMNFEISNPINNNFYAIVLFFLLFSLRDRQKERFYTNNYLLDLILSKLPPGLSFNPDPNANLAITIELIP